MDHSSDVSPPKPASPDQLKFVPPTQLPSAPVPPVQSEGWAPPAAMPVEHPAAFLPLAHVPVPPLAISEQKLTSCGFSYSFFCDPIANLLSYKVLPYFLFSLLKPVVSFSKNSTIREESPIMSHLAIPVRCPNGLIAVIILSYTASEAHPLHETIAADPLQTSW
jgi:hypothetical protein